jgi:hypothetical protein
MYLEQTEVSEDYMDGYKAGKNSVFYYLRELFGDDLESASSKFSRLATFLEQKKAVAESEVNEQAQSTNHI